MTGKPEGADRRGVWDTWRGAGQQGRWARTLRRAGPEERAGLLIPEPGAGERVGASGSHCHMECARGAGCPEPDCTAFPGCLFSRVGRGAP